MSNLTMLNKMVLYFLFVPL